MDKIITINWELLGAKLASLSDIEQADFFNGFARELINYDTHSSREYQMLAVRNKLSLKSKKVLEEYLPCLWYDNKEGE